MSRIHRLLQSPALPPVSEAAPPPAPVTTPAWPITDSVELPRLDLLAPPPASDLEATHRARVRQGARAFTPSETAELTRAFAALAAVRDT
jgi:hypothetical protein